ncbi:tetratricopeptide repeat protein [Neotamlana laminarinivorans]|uniref:Tetratricopeptide repeat protein n=1 Tax=Neotamlana laminarinivorans TaxID=2883124 RepID=A0A9X1L3D8_9FLAO|nr:tetratricopeptide repeat protein [Tamlana laminarinivorans]MCB4798147.1 tetratricopeptide repeat protein [Tamlana laminarinivorans]
MKKTIYILIFFISVVTFSQNQSLFEKANALYNDGKYAEAIDDYMAILETGNHSAELYFNLGNANYKLNNIAPSIYYYEKALRLDPDNTDIKNNLAYAQNMTIDVVDVVPDSGISKLLKSLANKFTFDFWAKLAIVFVFVFVVLFLLYYFAYTTIRKRISFIASILALILMSITLTLAFYKFDLDKTDNPAIVFAQESKIKSGPNLNSEEAFRLHEGTKVQVLETFDNWKKIKLADGKTGWVIQEDIKMLK